MEPDIAEGSGLRHIVGNCGLQMSYLSDFGKLKLRLHYKRKTAKLVLHLICEPINVQSCALYHIKGINEFYNNNLFQRKSDRKN